MALQLSCLLRHAKQTDSTLDLTQLSLCPQVCEAVERMPGILEPLAPKEEGGQPRPRTLQTWAPKKTQKVWSPK